LERLPRKSFDLVVCNIDAPTTTLLFPKLLNALSPGGLLVLSGLLTSDLPNFLDSIKARGAVPLEIVSENEWVGLALAKANAR
ncbi:MAG: 50S ribosomal protein L11 methyltransferase, partial [Bacteroidota bacterium]